MYMRHNRIVGPVAMIAVGVLFLLQEFTHYGFHRTWPILLIAIGAAMVLQRSSDSDPSLPAATPGPGASPNDTSEKR
jgi:hypothetical protein